MNYILPINWQVRSKSGYWKKKKGVIWYLVGKKTGSNNKIQDCTSTEIFVVYWWVVPHVCFLMHKSRWPCKSAHFSHEWHTRDLELELNNQKATRRERKNWHSSQYKWCLVILNQWMEDFSLDTPFGLQWQGWWWRRKISKTLFLSSPNVLMCGMELMQLKWSFIHTWK